MNKPNSSNFLIFTIILLFPIIGFSQKLNSKDSLQQKIKTAALEIMGTVKTCALITLDEENRRTCFNSTHYF